MSRLVVVLLMAVVLVAQGGRTKKTSKKATKEDGQEQPANKVGEHSVAGATFNPYYQIQFAFKKAGYTAPQVKKIQEKLWADKLRTTQWPFSDRAKELSRSVSNTANNHADLIAEAIVKAGGDPSDPTTLTEEVQKKAADILAGGPKEDQPESLLQKAQLNSSQQHEVQIEALIVQLTMAVGSVASNTGALGALAGTAATNTAAIAALGGNVATLTAVTGPTIALASTLGVSVSTVSTLALAGSFAGPLLGLMALVYAAWPEEEIDPWFQIESRVAKMLSEAFDGKRRKKLGDRQRRYIKQFSRCSQAWIANAMVELHGVSVPRWLVEEAAQAKVREASGGVFALTGSPPRGYPCPRCMSQLEGHMSLERDEWFGTENNGFSGLFMPFANMHTQILSLLADNPDDVKMNWDATLRATSAEYGVYMLDYLKGAWNAQVCRSMRLRHSLAGVTGGWKYSFVVLREVMQPNAAAECDTACGGKAGWCNFCGGKTRGACCKAGDKTGVCARFDPPVGYYNKQAYSACVQTDCIQSNTGYHGTELKLLKLATTDPDKCRQKCHGVVGAVAFRSDNTDCHCMGKKDLLRHQEEGVFSGPTVCPDMSLKQEEDEFAANLEEQAKVPVEEVSPCEKSPPVSNFKELQAKHPDWVRQCISKATEALASSFNKFNVPFAKFLDSLAWKSGCAAKHEAKWNQEEGFTTAAKDFDAGLFSSCPWGTKEQEEEKDNKNVWMVDETAARGWTGTSRINLDEQKAATMKYTMPAWLHDIYKVRTCMKSTAAGGQVEDPNSPQGAAVGTIMGPVASPNEFV